MELILLNWIITGTIFALLSIGLSLVFGMGSVVNLAHGSLYAIGAYTFVYYLNTIGDSYIVALFAAMLFSSLCWIIIEVCLISWLRRRANLVLESLLLTFGLSLLITGLLQWLWGPQPISPSIPDVMAGSVQITENLSYPTYRLVLASIAIVAALAALGLLYATRWGLFVRAADSRPDMARSCGLPVFSLRWQVFALGAGLAGLAGALMTPLTSAVPAMGNEILVSAFIVVVIGGLGSLRGALAASFIVAGIQVAGERILGGALGTVVIYAIVFCSLLFLPAGIFREGRFE